MKQYETIDERMAALNPLGEGGHKPDGVMCAMEAAAYVAGEEWTDHPQCVCPVIAAFCRTWNDNLPTDAERDRLLKPLIPQLIQTRSMPDVETRRAWLATDWLVRTCAPAWLALVKELEPHARALRELPEIVTSGLAREHQLMINAARVAARVAARDAAREAAREASWAAALSTARAAALSTALDAAWAASWAAARAAALSTARAAALSTALDAAWAASWAASWAATRNAARAALQPTVGTLQQSAIGLLHRMMAEGARER